MKRRTLRQRYGYAALKGIGRIAGRKIVYVQVGDRVEEHTLSSFRQKYGVSASKLTTGQTVEVPCVDCGVDLVFDPTRRVQRCDQCEENAGGPVYAS